MIVAIVVGVTFGLLAGRYRDTWIDGGGRIFGIVIYAMPVFFLGLMAQLFFGSYLGWLPTSDRASPIVDATLETHTNIYTIDTLINRDWDAFVDVSKHLILPAVTLGLVTAGVFIRLDPRQRDQDDERRLHRGGASARCRRALGRVPPCIQERARAGDHGRRTRRSRCFSRARC